MKILAKYIIRQALITLFMALAVFTFVLLVAQMLRQLSEMLVNQRIGLEVIAYFVVLVTPYVLSFTLPMAMLAMTLLVFGRLSADNELTAMRASGVGLGAVVAPIILLATLMAGVCLYINTTLAPQCRTAFSTELLQLGIEKPLALLEEQTYIKDFPGFVIYLSRKKANVLEDVIIHTLSTNGEVMSTLRAQKAVVTSQRAAGKLLLVLYNVTGDVRDPLDPTNVRKIHAGTTAARYPLELDIGLAMRRSLASKRVSDMLFGELLEEIRSLRARGIYPGGALLEAHWRAASAMACLAFTLIGVPLGIKTSRRETSVGIAISLGLTMAFYVMMLLANTFKNRPHLYPEAFLWGPLLVFEILGLWLLWRVARA